MTDNKTKNNLKKFLILDLSKKFADRVSFCGSICEYFYTGLPLEDVKDLDINVKFSDRNKIINLLLNSEFCVRTKEGKPFFVQPNKIHPTLLNFSIHKNTYSCSNRPAFVFSYHFFLFGTCLDIGFDIVDEEDINHSIKYKNYFNNPKMSNNIIDNYHEIFINDTKINLQTKNSRIETLKHNIKNVFDTKIKTKHQRRLERYSIDSLGSIAKNKNIFNKIEYLLPPNFDPRLYQKKNNDLKQIISKDGLIDHFLSHGIQENRKYY
jgi:hypothetical protein